MGVEKVFLAADKTNLLRYFWRRIEKSTANSAKVLGGTNH